MRKVLAVSAAVAATCASGAIIAPGSDAATPQAPAQTVTSGSQIATAEAFIVTLPPLRTSTHAYGSLERQSLDAYWRASGTGSTQPAILLLHGGYWLEGDKTSWRTIARRLANRGYAVFAADYRLSGAAIWPAQRDDAGLALQFIKQHAAQFGVDPSRIVVMGSSAGGQLATMLGTYGAGAQQVRGVVALSPVNSPYLGYVDGARSGANTYEIKLRNAVRRLLGCTPQDGGSSCWQRLDDVAPATYADAGDAPMLILHSTGEFVPPAHSTEVVTTLQSFGVDTTLQEVPGTAHGTGVLSDPQIWQTVVTWIDSVAKGRT